MTKGLTLTGVCFLMVLCIFISGCFGGGITEEELAIREQEREQQQAESETLAWKMAVIGEGGFVPYGGDLEKEYEWYLNKLAEKTTQDKEEVANITVRAWNMLREEVNPNEDLLDVLQNDVD